MASSRDIEVRLKMSTGEYDNKIKQATQRLQELKQVGDLSTKAFESMKDSMLKLGSALVAGSTAMSAFQNYVSATQDATDEWGRTMESANAIASAFFSSLNRADFSGFVSQLGTIASAARDAYDAMDMLGSMNIYYSLDASKKQLKLDELKAKYNDPHTTDGQKKAIAQEMVQAQREMMAMANKMASASQGAYLSKMQEELAKQGYDKKINSDWYDKHGTMEAYLANERKYAELKKKEDALVKASSTTVYTMSGGGLGVQMNKTGKDAFTAAAELKKLRQSDDYKLSVALHNIGDEDLKAAQDAAQMGVAAQRAALQMRQQINRRTSSILGGSSHASSGSSHASSGDKLQIGQLSFPTIENGKKQLDEMKAAIDGIQIPELDFKSNGYIDPAQKVRDVAAAYDDACRSIEQYDALITYASGDEKKQLESARARIVEYRDSIEPVSKRNERMMEQFKGIWSGVQTVSSGFDGLTTAMDNDATAWQRISGLVGGVLNLIEGFNAVAKILQTITIASSATTVTAEAGKAVAYHASAEAARQSAAAEYFAAHAYIPFAGAGIASGYVAEMNGVLLAQQSLPTFANGGIVPGGSWAGDNVVARVNSGEMVLNGTQQKKLYESLKGVGGANGLGDITTTLRGQDLYLTISNYMKSSGRTWR